jgi:hypothetical protein
MRRSARIVAVAAPLIPRSISPRILIEGTSANRLEVRKWQGVAVSAKRANAIATRIPDADLWGEIGLL